MEDLIAFLRERLDEDEQAAREVPWDRNTQWWTESSPCRWGEPIVHTVWGHGGPIAVMHEDASGSDDHIARHDPARVLAEVDAKRRIIDAYLDVRTRRDIYQSEDARAAEDEDQVRRRRSSAARCHGLEIAVCLLALPYADEPGYREEWRP